MFEQKHGSGHQLVPQRTGYHLLSQPELDSVQLPEVGQHRHALLRDCGQIHDVARLPVVRRKHLHQVAHVHAII